MIEDSVNVIRPGYHHIGHFGGQERYVRYDLNAFAEMERMYGSMEAANAALTKGSMTDVRRILWLGLIHDQAVLDEVTGEPIKYKLTVYEVGTWITPANMKDIMQKLNGAINASVPSESQASGGSTTPAQAHAQATSEVSSEVSPVTVPFKAPN